MIRLYIIAAVLAILTGCKANPTIPSDGYGELAVTTVSALALEPVAGLYDVSLVQQHYDGQLTGAQASAIALLRDWQWWPQYGEEPAVTVLAAQLAQYREDLLTPGENYLGLSNDPWLLERLQAGLVHEPNKRVDNTLRQWLDKQVVAKKLTGYNLTLRSDAPGFKSDYSVLYGHSNALHMRQLVALLNQQDVLAKVALVPKHSIFVYLPEWGEAAYGVDTMADGTMLARAEEYNLQFEFFDSSGRSQFLRLVQTYAKQDDQNKGLLAGAWWQPFLATNTAAKGFKQVYQFRFSYANWQAVSIVTNNNIDLGLLPEGVNQSVHNVWVNPAFYRYLTGADHQ